uniref:MAM domain-containing protein n=1 Tax=Panagrolaimus sp. PS1159 TaxID=55785 RepID=A0AC35FHG1_9BILA
MSNLTILVIFVIFFNFVYGKTLQLEHLLNSPSAGGDMDFVKANATNAMNLTCTEFDSSCQWHNLKDSSVSLKWFQSSAYLDPNFFKIATGASAVPTGNYAVAASDDPTNLNASATLMSDVVKCPMGTNGFSFMYWLSPKVKLTICLKSITRVYPNYDFCNDLNTTMSPGPLKVIIPPLQNDSFQIFITASNFVSNTGDFQGGFAIIDNLNFILESCLSPSSVASTPGIIPSLTSPNPSSGLTGGTTTIRMGGSSGATSAPGGTGTTSGPAATGAAIGSTGGGMVMTTPSSGAAAATGGTVTGGASNVTVMISGMTSSMTMTVAPSWGLRPSFPTFQIPSNNQSNALPGGSGVTGGAVGATTMASASGGNNGSMSTSSGGTGATSSKPMMTGSTSAMTGAAGSLNPNTATTIPSASGSGGSSGTTMATGSSGGNATSMPSATGGIGATSPKPMMTGSTSAMTGATGPTAKPFELNSTAPIPTFATLAIALVPTTTLPPPLTGGSTTMRVTSAVTGSTMAGPGSGTGSATPTGIMATGVTGATGAAPTGMMATGGSAAPTGMMATGTAMSGATTMRPVTTMSGGSTVAGVTGGTTMASSGASSGGSMANPSGSSAASGGSAMTTPAAAQTTTGPWPTIVLNSMSPLPMNLPTFAAGATTARPATSSSSSVSGAPMGSTMASGSGTTGAQMGSTGGMAGGTTMASGSGGSAGTMGSTGGTAGGTMASGTGAAGMGTTTPRPANSSMTTPNVTLVSRETGGGVSLPPTPGKVLELNSTAPWPTFPTVAVTAAAGSTASGSSSGNMGGSGGTTTMVAPTGMISTNSTGMAGSAASGMPTTMRPATTAMSGGSTVAGGMGMSGTTMAGPGSSSADHTKACAALVCTFDPTSACSNDLMGTVWKTSSTMVGNDTLSISPDTAGNTFAYVTGPLRWSRLLLDPFELDKTVNFVFNFKLALQTTSIAKLFVYAKRNDSLVETSLVTPEQPKGDLGWRNTSAILLVGAYEYVAFEVKNLGPSEIIAIDTTRLTPIFDVEYCPSSSSSAVAAPASGSASGSTNSTITG